MRAYDKQYTIESKHSDINERLFIYYYFFALSSFPTTSSSSSYAYIQRVMLTIEEFRLGIIQIGV